MKQADIENMEDLEAQRLVDEERQLVELNNQLEQEIKAVECELSMEGMRLKEVKQKNEDLDALVSGVKELGEKLKNEQQYKKYGYVTKQDLINVFKKRQLAESRKPAEAQASQET